MTDSFKHEPTEMTLQHRAVAMVNKPAPCSSAPVNSFDVNLPAKMMFWGVKFRKNSLHIHYIWTNTGFQIWDTLAVAYLKSHRWRLITYYVWTGYTHLTLLFFLLYWLKVWTASLVMSLSICYRPWRRAQTDNFRYMTRWLLHKPPFYH